MPMFFKGSRYKGSTPAPLTAPELERLKAWEWWMLRFYTVAGILMCATILTVGLWGSDPFIRRGAVALVIVLVMGATWVQFREACPRCKALLGRQSKLVLPPKCKRCGVRFDISGPPRT